MGDSQVSTSVSCQCPASDQVTCKTPIFDSCGNSCGTEGTKQDCSVLDPATVGKCDGRYRDRCGNDCGAQPVCCDAAVAAGYFTDQTFIGADGVTVCTGTANRPPPEDPPGGGGGGGGGGRSCVDGYGPDIGRVLQVSIKGGPVISSEPPGTCCGTGCSANGGIPCDAAPDGATLYNNCSAGWKD